MRTATVSAAICLLAWSLGTCNASASETAAATPPAAAQETAAATPLTRSQKLFGTFSRYKSFDYGAPYTYQLVEKDGEKVYCQQEVITGTRVGKRGVCLTQQQMEAREETRRRTTEQLLRQGENSRVNPPPRDGNGGRYNNAVGGTNIPTS